MTTTSPATRPETAPQQPARPLWWGALDGLVAGLLTVGLATLAAALLTAVGQSSGQPAPIAAVSGAFIDRTPPWLKDVAIATFGTNDKRALLVGTVVVLALACAAVGILASRRLVAGLVVFAVIGVIGAAAVLTRPGAGPADVLPTILGTAAGLWFLSRAAAPSASATGAAGPGRRWIIGGAVGAVAAYAGAYLGVTPRRPRSRATPSRARRSRARRLAIPAGADLKVPGLTPYIVPNADFYRIDTAIVVPRIDANDWCSRSPAWSTARSRSTGRRCRASRCRRRWSP